MMWYEYPGVAERFDSKVERSATCWLWTAAKFKQGYGAFRLAWPVRRQGYAHRLTLERKLGRALKTKEYALHSCDVPECVNPDHLSVGDQWKNMGDAAERGRTSRGEGHTSSRLTEQDVREIKALLLVGTQQKEIARRYGVTRGAVTSINTGRSWRHITAPRA